MLDPWNKFIKDFYKLTNIDLNHYKRLQMERRINSFMEEKGYDNYIIFCRRLEQDSGLLNEFLSKLTINVTEFFRNKDYWNILEKELIPGIILKEDSNYKLKAWSAGCSTGEEPYSLSLLFNEKFRNRLQYILATDIDEDILERAKEGFYNNIKGLENYYLTKYFVREEGGYRANEYIRNRVIFKKHNLLEDSFQKNFDLILCRNVIIYFNASSKNMLIKNLSEALKKGGYLFLGGSEQIFNPAELNLELVEGFFYKKTR